MEQVLHAVMTGLVGIVVAVVTYAARFLVDFINKKAAEATAAKSREEIELAQSIGLIAVDAAEQVGRVLKLDGTDKFNLAVKQFNEMAERYGLKISDDQRKALIEAGVNGLHSVDEAVKDVLTKPVK